MPTAIKKYPHVVRKQWEQIILDDKGGTATATEYYQQRVVWVEHIEDAHIFDNKKDAETAIAIGPDPDPISNPTFEAVPVILMEMSKWKDDLLAKIKLFERALSFDVDGKSRVKIERRDGIADPGLWAITDGSQNLGKDLKWHHEPLPSNRDDEFLDLCRYNSIGEAIKTIEKAVADGGMPFENREAIKT
jgi:hypothetical protein